MATARPPQHIMVYSEQQLQDGGEVTPTHPPPFIPEHLVNGPIQGDARKLGDQCLGYNADSAPSYPSTPPKATSYVDSPHKTVISKCPSIFCPFLPLRQSPSALAQFPPPGTNAG